MFTNTAAQSEAIRQQQLSPIYAFQDQLRQGNPADAMQRQLQLQDINRQGRMAQGQYSFDAQREEIEAGAAMNRANMIRDAFGILSTGVNTFGMAYNPADSGNSPVMPSSRYTSTRSSGA